MDNSLKKNLLQCIGDIFEYSKKSNLTANLLSEMDKELTYLAEYLSSTKREAFIFAHIFILNYKGDTVDIMDLVEHFECNPVKVLELSEDFESLCEKKILKREKSRHRTEVFLSNDQFTVEKRVTEAVMRSKPIPEPDNEAPETVVEVLEKLNKLGQEVEDEEIIQPRFFREVENTLETNKHFPLIKYVLDKRLSIIDAYIFLYVVWKTLNGLESTLLSAPLDITIRSSSKRISYLQSIIKGDNELVRQDMLEVVETNFFNDSEIKLSSSSVEMLSNFGIKLFTSKIRSGSLVKPSAIKSKELFFNKRESESLGMLYELLNEGNIQQIQSRLRGKNLPTGITVLMHGAPGTGKTETAYQIARETNREIVRVDISQTKSLWFGESEKIARRIFKEYNDYCLQCSSAPILLFNEADAIISKRKDVAGSSVGQTENTIQNIILEELENFKGIFFATTNLTINIDAAFDRRFLFKIEFSKPGTNVKAKIWQSKLPNLAKGHCEAIATMFDFSGGQIDNIVRKSEMYEVLQGVSANFEKLVEFCEAEQMQGSKGKRIGFGKNG